MPFAGDGDGEVALRSEHVGDVSVPGMARHRAPARKAGPVAGGFAARSAAIAGAVAAMEEQHERHRAGVTDGRGDFRQDFDRRGIVRQRKSRQFVLQASGFIGAVRGRVECRLCDGRLGGRRDERHLQPRLQGIAVEAAAGGPDRQLVRRRPRRKPQTQRVAALLGIAEQPLAGAEHVARAAHAQRRVARPHELAALELPAGRQRGGSCRGGP